MQSTNTILNKRVPLLDSGASYITREGGALIADVGSMGTVTDKWTIATWIKRQRATATTETIFNLRNNISNLQGNINFSNWFTGAGDLRFAVSSALGLQPNNYNILDLPVFDLNASWEFFVFTYDYNSGTVLQNFYYDGGLLDETPGSGVGDPYLDHDTVGNPEQTGINKYIGIGNFFTNDPPGFEGRVFNWSMWDRVLSAAEVTTLYNGGNGFVVDYTKAYLSYKPTGLNFHYTFDDVANRGLNRGSVARDLADDEQGLATYTVDDLPGNNDPTVYLLDEMSYMLNPGAAANAQYITGDDLLSTVYPSDLNTISFSLWYNPGSHTPAAFDTIMGSSTNWSNWTDGFGLYFETATSLTFWVNTWNNVNSHVTGGTLAADTWYHIVGVYDGPNTTLTLYINNAVVAQDTSSISANLLRTGTQNFALGRTGNLNQSATGYGSGYFGEVALFDRVLTDAERKSLYNDGVPGSPGSMSGLRMWWRMEESLGDDDDLAGTPVVNDQSGNVFDGTPTVAGSNAGDGLNAFRLTEDKPTFQSVSAQFSSSTDYIETKSISPNLGIHGSDWTAACWFKPTSTPAATDEPIIFETTDPSDESVFRLYIDDADDLHVKLWDTNGTLFKHFTSNVSLINQNEWNYIAFTFVNTGDVLTVYAGYEVNESVQDVSTSFMDKTVDNAGTMPNEGPQTIRLGNNAAHDTNFPGLIYSVSLWDDDLTLAELSELKGMWSFRSPVSGNYGAYTSDFNLDYHYDWRNTYFIGDNREPGRTAPSIDTSVGGVWPPSNTDVPPRFSPSGG